MNHQQTIGVLALQGAFIEHEQKLTSLGLHCREIRQRADLDDDLSGLVLPGGESSVQKKLLRDLNLFLPLQERIRQGMPVLATCAGLILLAAATVKLLQLFLSRALLDRTQRWRHQ